MLPFAAGEVGDFDGSVSLGDGFDAEWADGRPGRGVVDVHVRWEAFAQALEEAIDHDEIHAAMAADFLGDFSLARPERMLVLLEVVDGAPRLIFVHAVDVDAGWVVLEDGFGSGDLVDAAVGVRRGDGVLDADGEPGSRFDE